MDDAAPNTVAVPPSLSRPQPMSADTSLTFMRTLVGMLTVFNSDGLLTNADSGGRYGGTLAPRVLEHTPKHCEKATWPDTSTSPAFSVMEALVRLVARARFLCEQAQGEGITASHTSQQNRNTSQAESIRCNVRMTGQQQCAIIADQAT
jgi:hypothetical protein